MTSAPISAPVYDLAPGSGRIHATLNSPQEALEPLGIKGQIEYPHFAYTYPLKFLASRALQPGVGCVYNLSYGGGMVDGDKVEIDLRVDGGATFCLLTQGSTKVFKRRRTLSATGNGVDSSIKGEMTVAGAVSNLTAHVGPKSTLLLLPCPVSPFKNSMFQQVQSIHLEEPSSSLVLLDWFTAGRPGHGDRWAFYSYLSDISIHANGRLLLRDFMEVVPHRVPYLGPYGCFATLIVWGEQVMPTITYLRETGAERTLQTHRTPPSRIWSVCDTRDGAGVVVRCSALSTEEVTEWLHEILGVLSDLCGADVLARAMDN